MTTLEKLIELRNMLDKPGILRNTEYDHIKIIAPLRPSVTLLKNECDDKPFKCLYVAV